MEYSTPMTGQIINNIEFGPRVCFKRLDFNPANSD
jgi:hypothetical protein